MNSDTLTSLVFRLLWLGAFGLAGLAVLEFLSNALGYTILRGTYSAGRLLELAAVLLVFVITALLRQIRQELRAEKAGS